MPDGPTDTRAKLAQRQAALLAGLVSGRSPPEGFDAPRVRLAGAGLLRKRARGVARAWPRLAAELASDFATTFGRYASCTNTPPGGPLHDGCLFATWLHRAGQLPAAACAEVVTARLLHPTLAPAPRLGNRIAVRWLRCAHGTVVGVRIAGHVWLLRVPGFPGAGHARARSIQAAP